jgi:hypothetical protein
MIFRLKPLDHPCKVLRTKPAKPHFNGFEIRTIKLYIHVLRRKWPNPCACRTGHLNDIDVCLASISRNMLHNASIVIKSKDMLHNIHDGTRHDTSD